MGSPHPSPALTDRPWAHGPERSSSGAPAPAGDAGSTVTEQVTGISAPEAQATAPRRSRRLLISYGVTLAVLVTLNFLLPRAMPGDPITALVEPGSGTYVEDAALRAELESYYGLDRPLWEQYFGYLGGLATGDLGTSIRYNAPVSELISERLPWTLLLFATALALAATVGLALGVHSAWRRGRAVDQGLLVLFLGLHNLPVFFLGSLALLVFSVKLGWVPLAGTSTPYASFGPLEQVADVAHHLVLPAIVLATGFSAAYYLVMRASMVGELGADYLVLGRAKGLRQRQLKYRYAGRNALLPVVTLAALRMEFLVTGSILVETVFAYQGLGRLLFDSVSFRDYPVLQACFLIFTLIVVGANLAAELLYGRLDPRTA